MPRAFDRGVPPLDKNPLQSATSWDDPQGIIGEAANIYGEFLKQWVTTLLEDGLANVFKDCTGGIIEGLRQLGVGETDLAKIGDGLNNFIDTLVNTLLCRTEGAVTPQDILATVGNIVDLLGASPIVQQLQALVESSGSGLQDALGGLFTVLTGFLGEFTIEGFLMPLLDWVRWLWDQFGVVSETFLKPVLTLIKNVWDAFTVAATTAGSTAAAWLGDLFDFLGWLWESFGAALETFLKPIMTWLKSIWDLFGGGVGGSDALTALFNWLNDLWTKLGATVLAAFNNLIQAVSGLISLPTLQSLIEKIAAAFTGILNPQNFVDLLVQIIEYFRSLFKTKSLTDFTNSLPIIGPLVSAITGLTEADGVTLDLGQLGSFFRKLEKQATISDDTLADIGRKVMGGILSIGMLNTAEPNLLSQGDFASAATIEAADGWSWDNTVSATSTGGALLATATGSLQQMYSKQSIKVLANDKIKVSASVLTSGFTSGSMTLSIVYWVGSTPTTHVVATRTSSASTFQEMTGSTIIIGGTAGAGEISIPSSATSIQVRLAVNANAGAKVWFDDVAVRKTGLVEQTWVDKLPETWVGAWNAVFGSGGTGKIWSDFVTALSTTYTKAKNGEEGATTANGNITTMIDGIGQAVFGDAGYASLSKTVKESIRKLVSTLFGLNYVAAELTSGVVPDLDGSIITTGTIPLDVVPDLPGGQITSGTVAVNYLPTGEISSALGTTGSGAKMSRTFTNGFFPANSGGNVFINFWNNLERATADITVWPYASQFTVSQTGWYIVEVGFTVNANPGYVGYFNVAPAVFVNGALNKVGGDALGSYGGGLGNWSRSAQGSFIVYLAAGNTVQGGYYNYGTTINDFFQGQAGGYACYMSMSMLNKGLGA